MNMRNRIHLAWLLLATFLAACIPTSSTTIALGAGHGLVEMDRIDTLLERSGFTRTWFIGSNGERVPRMEREGKVISAFVTESPRGLGAAVVWTKNGGVLEVAFSEYDTHFSERGNASLQALLTEFRALYGADVTLLK
ncbi:MAG: hypothetical protein IPL72_16845 [Sulfuritalea sp.]|nr:hypothetical protein [Sulfuritalea sp.]